MTKIIKTTWFPFGRYMAIALWPLIFTKGNCKDYMIRHEKIHHRQQTELLLIGFYLLYALLYAYLFIKHTLGDWGLTFRQVCDKAYRSNPFEREAYDHQKDADYLKNREYFSWIKYIKL